MPDTELTPNEHQLLAREVAADRRIDGSGWYNDNMREVFVSGWDAAMEYVNKKLAEGVEHLDGSEMDNNG